MAASEGFHSGLVAALKLILPLAALAILSTLFLLSRGRDPGPGLPYSDGDLETLLRDQRITAPTHVGVTRDGAAITLTAETARPDGGQGGGSAQSARLLLVTPDGVQTTVDAARAAIDPVTRLLTLSGGMRLISGTGYTIDAAEVTATLDRTLIESTGSVRATGPLGTISASAMRITQSGSGSDYVLVFNGDVKLVYDPRK